VVPAAGGGVVTLFAMLWIAFAIAKWIRTKRNNRASVVANVETNTLVLTTSENRRTVASSIMNVLYGLALTNMMITLADALNKDKLFFVDIALASIFFLVSLRFIIGNQIHIASDAMVTKNEAFAWMFDFTVITVQFALFIFLASLATVQSTQEKEYGFVELLIMIYCIDVVWIVLQCVPVAGNRRKKIPWQWACLNAVVILAMICVNAIWNQIYSATPMVWLLGINLLAFFVDVVLCDYVGLYAFLGRQGLGSAHGRR
jgi:hypothetical protein